MSPHRLELQSVSGKPNTSPAVYVLFFQGSWNLKPKIKTVLTKQHVMLSSGTAQVTSSKKSNALNVAWLRRNSLALCWLWHFSLDRFESCWPALMKDSNGVVIVFNPDVPSHLKEMETWHSMFISSQGLQDSQCLLIAHHKPGSGDGDERLPLGNTFYTIQLFCE